MSISNGVKIIIGLGNPEKKYESTRHNLGRLIVKRFQKQAGFPDFKLKKKFQSLISENKFNKGKIILALPETSMNLSGKSIKSLIANYKLPIIHLLIIHDDFDLELGKIRISKNRGAAGHKGVQSIINELKTKDFIRFRIGIKPKRKPKNLDKFVLKKFTGTEQKIIKKVIEKTLNAIEVFLNQGFEKAMSEFNKE
jgi:PTH1 family peptidyl-tRNA hydrolase